MKLNIQFYHNYTMFLHLQETQIFRNIFKCTKLSYCLGYCYSTIEKLQHSEMSNNVVKILRAVITQIFRITVLFKLSNVTSM